MFIGKSRVILQLTNQLSNYASTRFPVLITGASGTGKELSARFIHQASGESGPFLAVNCGTLTESLADSELFGHQRGAFTQAFESSAGLCLAADGGTLFLDEIGELPLPVQSKLLRFLDDGQIRPVGAVTYTHADVRIIAATNRELMQEISAGRFRSDLYYRLSALQIRMPDLSEHSEDIPLLAEHFLQQLNLPRHFTPEALQHLTSLAYPGNVRQLRNIVCQAALKAASTSITIQDLPAPATFTFSPDTLQEISAAWLNNTLQGKNYTQTARILGIHRNTLRRWLQK